MKINQELYAQYRYYKQFGIESYGYARFLLHFKVLRLRRDIGRVFNYKESFR